MKTNRLLKFLIITFLITGISWGLLVTVTKLNIIAFSHPIGTLLHMLGGFGPTIATLFVMEEKPSIKSVLRFVFHYEKKTLIYFWILTIMDIPWTYKYTFIYVYNQTKCSFSDRFDWHVGLFNISLVCRR